MSFIIRNKAAETDEKDRVFLAWSGVPGELVHTCTRDDAYRFDSREVADLFCTAIMAWAAEVKLSAEDEDEAAEEARKLEKAKRAEEKARAAKAERAKRVEGVLRSSAEINDEDVAIVLRAIEAS